MIGIVDYGMGNVRSILNALTWIGCDAQISAEPARLREAERYILPGVGAFGDAMAAIRARGLDAFLDAEVRGKGKPLLGICLGMQLLARSSEEHGTHDGLGWIDAHVVRFETSASLKVPHVGWNDVGYAEGDPLFRGLKSGEHAFYFVHSFHVKCREGADVIASCDYGGRFTAAIRNGPVVATQFHPEKSQDNGIQVLRNFLEWTP